MIRDWVDAVCLAALFLVGVIMFGVAVDYPHLEELWP